MTEKIVVKDLYKIFGPSPEQALTLLAEGKSKDDIFKQSGNTVGVQAANFTIKEGEIFVVMGLSGSGKSTLVRMLNRLIKPTAGTVYVDGVDVTHMSRRQLIELRRAEMTMVFQSFALMPHRTTLENVAFGLEVAGVEKSIRHERAYQALDQVGLKANARSYPDELSGGMQQRVGLARALAVNPSVMLMDEAFSALDPLIRTEMQDELLQLQAQSRRTVVFISHDLDEAIRIGDRIAIMEAGAVVQVGTPEEIVNHPANEYVRSFFYGVDVSQVYSAKDIVDSESVPVFSSPQLTVQAAQEALFKQAAHCAVVTDEMGHFLGMVTIDSLQQSQAAQQATLSDALVTAISTIPAGMPLHKLIKQAADSTLPLPVVDEQKIYCGSITQNNVLKTLVRKVT
ncbi:glycine betaine/L-proline ABC transporter ATP-binding protein ProV [Zooshikella harenae]|uniref:Quaternary amine transport ATP-binding protein n=1 Tax=Zooshikella harenae TaxID=2827238 RepID=A0ABS5Z9J3_9GAMM|nr:glycine betaine/L-proline ABC transporter ATP-binding protein ProV [Zooshikella harenae]MBU2709557.1 glycine betaine/L-proline ABC transporter ATP-binding protein ProV [Zooshikella harenae]